MYQSKSGIRAKKSHPAHQLLCQPGSLGWNAIQGPHIRVNLHVLDFCLHLVKSRIIEPRRGLAERYNLDHLGQSVISRPLKA